MTARKSFNARLRTATPPIVGGLVASTLLITACRTQSEYASIGTLTPTVAVGSRGYELYQNNCAACHGPAGRGDGMFAFVLNTRPRDFWNEPFRYVSTLDGIATKEDVIQSIQHGRINGEMPGGQWLTGDDLSVLADFVIELNRLGWEERLREEFAAEGLSEEEIQEISLERVTTEQPAQTPVPSPSFAADLARGRDLYAQSCASCHGLSGRGDGLDVPRDEQGRAIAVRDLANEPIRGGDSPEELFNRIRSGIPGTPMPGQPLMAPDDVWQLVHYTRYIMGRPISSSPDALLTPSTDR